MKIAVVITDKLIRYEYFMSLDFCAVTSFSKIPMAVQIVVRFDLFVKQD